MSEKIDDSDPRLIYAPASDWHTTGSSNEYNNTIHFTGNGGATVSLIFNGTGVGVYGTIAVASNPGGAPITVFSLDGDVDRAEYSAVPPQSTDLYMQRWYYSPPLENGQHTLVASNYLNGASMYLDYFVVTTPTSTPSTQLTSDSNPKSLTTAGAIVGGVLGGVIIILTAVIVILLARSRRQKAEATEMGASERVFTERRQPTITPFEAESLLPPSNVYMQPRLAASDTIAIPNMSSTSMSQTTTARMLAPVHKPSPSIGSTPAASSQPTRLQGDSLNAEVPTGPPTNIRESRYDAPPGYGT